MKLRAWLEKEGLSATEFGRRLNKPQPTIARYASGDRIPEPPVMAQIAEMTRGEVMPNDFYDLAPPTSPADPSDSESERAS
jgi:transcriptional regulator with XRE-family HTH domain